jgi:thiol-disulfide isomerase/thioredoxin
MKTYFFIIALLIVSSSIKGQEIVETLPTFFLKDIDGKMFTNEDISNRKRSYIVYFNPECGHCETAFKKLNENVEKLDLKQVVFYAIAANTKEKTDEFFKTIAPEVLKLKNLKILLDEDFIFANAFNVGSYPTIYFYDPKSKEMQRYEGSEDVLKPILELN